MLKERDMAKCAICNSRKGKRKCIAEGDSFVCSLCCGQSRTADKCTGCSYYKNDSDGKNYQRIPGYGVKQMSDSMALQDIGNVVESILCRFDTESEFNDKSALQLLELAFDKYHFRVSDLVFSSSQLKTQFEKMMDMIEEELPDIPKEQLIKVMAAIYKSILKRTNGGREYLAFVQQYVGARLGSGLRVIKDFNFGGA